MKSIILILVGMLMLSCSKVKHDDTQVKFESQLSIVKQDEGFNIYSNTGELILEFTKQNSDSASLETLNYIYETAKNFYNKKPYREEKQIQTIKGS